jgi:hypothetical protein
VTQEAFRDRLAALLDAFLAEGGDPFWLCDEIQTAAMTVLGELHCDLVEANETEEAPY